MATIPAFVTASAATVADAAAANFNIWPIGPTFLDDGNVFWGTWDSEVIHLGDWLQQRIDWMSGELGG